jgi:hypothetical protein
MIELTILTAILIITSAVLFDRQQQRNANLLAHTLDQQESPDLTALIALIERQNQRIQAPEVAVAQHAAQDMPADLPQHVSTEDDDGFWKTKEQLADDEYDQELTGVGT